MNRFTLAALAAAFGLMLVSQDAHGAVRQYTTPVTSVLVGPNYNGCMIKVNEVDWALECANRDGYTWLTLDCEGEWMPLATAKNNLQQARIALLTGSQLSVVVDDRFITDGDYCLAKQTTLNK
jgi:hypothetical protein